MNVLSSDVLSSDILFAYGRKSVRSEHAIDGNIVVFVRNRLVRRLPRPANRHHPCAGRTILERAVIPPSATSQTESLLVDGKGGNNDQTGVFSASGPFALLPGSCGRCVLMDPSLLVWSCRS